MAGNIGANQYKQMAIKTATPAQILIMLYEGAIQNVKKAQGCIDQNDRVGKGQFIGKAHDIINELNSSLNFEVGGDIARNLERLYNYMVEQMIKSNLENTKDPLQNVQKLLENLLAGWRGAIDQVQKGTAAK